MNRKTILLTLTCCLATVGVRAQELSLFTPDAKSLSMGGVTITQLSASHTLYNNAASALFQPVQLQLSGSYCAPQGYDGYAASGFFNIASRHSVQAGWRQFHRERGVGETMVDAAYAFRPGVRWAIAVTGRYTHLRRTQGTDDALAADLSALYVQPLGTADRSAMRVGAKLSNLGGYFGDPNHELPVVLGAGAAFDTRLSDAHQLTVALDLNYAFNPSPVQGFGLSVGAEYNLMQFIQLRCGYHYGERSVSPDYGSVGAGLRFLHLRLDFTYLFAGADTWLRNLWGLSFGFDF